MGGSTYQHTVIKDYEYWTLCLSEEQMPYVGRCYAWYKDRWRGEGDNLPPWELPDHMQLEASKIVRDVIRAHAALGYETKPYGEKFLLNTCYLSNGEVHHHHLHWHYIPRSKISFSMPHGLKVVDERWGDNYIRTRDYSGDFRATPQQVAYIKKTMAGAIA